MLTARRVTVALCGAAVLLSGCTAEGSAAPATTVTNVVAPAVATTGPDAVPTATRATTSTATMTPEASSTAGGDARPAPAGTPAPTPSSATVASVQRALANSGYYTGPISGIQDVSTTAAMKRFQSAHGLEADGIAGPAFWAAYQGGAASTATTPAGQATPTDRATVDQGPTSTPEGPTDAETAAEAACSSYYTQWDQAVQAGIASKARAAHDKGAAAGCRPNTWLPSRVRTTFDPAREHAPGDPCRMSEVGTYDAAGHVCTQDEPGTPHWN